MPTIMSKERVAVLDTTDTFAVGVQRLGEQYKDPVATMLASEGLRSGKQALKVAIYQYGYHVTQVEKRLSEIDRILFAERHGRGPMDPDSAARSRVVAMLKTKDVAQLAKYAEKHNVSVASYADDTDGLIQAIADEMLVV